MPKIHYTRFPVTSPQKGKLRTCYGLVADLVATRPTSPQQVVVMEFGKRQDRTHTTDFCLRQHVTDLLRGNWCNGFWPLASHIFPFLFIYFHRYFHLYFRVYAPLPQGRVTRPSSPLSLLCLHLCVWSNPKATTYVRQACRR